MKALQPIERIEPPSPETFVARYLKPGRPVILTGAANDWPARKLWTPELLAARFGDRIVPAIRTVGGTLYDPQKGLNYEEVRLGHFARDVSAKPGPHPLYVVFRVHEKLPELMNDVTLPAYCGTPPWLRSRFWFGAEGTKGPFHRDLPYNLYAQVHGRKRFVLLDPWQGFRVPRHAWHSGVPNYSPVDAEVPDLKLFPRFEKAPLMVADLEPGDLFYIPPMWWHQARALSLSISLNLWWATGAMAQAARAAEWFMRVRQLKL